MVTLNWADWIIVSVVLISSLIGLKRGLVREALSLINLGVALFVALTHRAEAAAWLADYISYEPLRHAAAFIALFLSVLLLGACVNFLVGFVIKASGLSPIDRLLGIGFGLARGCLVVFSILVAISRFQIADHSEWWVSSAFIPNIMVIEQWASQTELDSVVWLKQFLNVGQSRGF